MRAFEKSNMSQIFNLFHVFQIIKTLIKNIKTAIQIIFAYKKMSKMSGKLKSARKEK